MSAQVEYVAGLLFYSPELKRASDRLKSPSATVALVLKARPAWQRGRFNGIGGHVEEGETPAQAMRREFREETGVDLDGWQHFATLRSGEAEKPWRVHWFRLDADRGHQLRGTPDEPVGWHRMDDIPLVIPNLHWLIPMAHRQQAASWPLEIIEKVTA